MKYPYQYWCIETDKKNFHSSRQKTWKEDWSGFASVSYCQRVLLSTEDQEEKGGPQHYQEEEGKRRGRQQCGKRWKKEEGGETSKDVLHQHREVPFKGHQGGDGDGSQLFW